MRRYCIAASNSTFTCFLMAAAHVGRQFSASFALAFPLEEYWFPMAHEAWISLYEMQASTMKPRIKLRIIVSVQILNFVKWLKINDIFLLIKGQQIRISGFLYRTTQLIQEHSLINIGHELVMQQNFCEMEYIWLLNVEVLLFYLVITIEIKSQVFIIIPVSKTLNKDNLLSN